MMQVILCIKTNYPIGSRLLLLDLPSHLGEHFWRGPSVPRGQSFQSSLTNWGCSSIRKREVSYRKRRRRKSFFSSSEEIKSKLQKRVNGAKVKTDKHEGEERLRNYLRKKLPDCIGCLRSWAHASLNFWAAAFVREPHLIKWKFL